MVATTRNCSMTSSWSSKASSGGALSDYTGPVARPNSHPRWNGVPVKTKVGLVVILSKESVSGDEDHGDSGDAGGEDIASNLATSESVQAGTGSGSGMEILALVSNNYGWRGRSHECLLRSSSSIFIIPQSSSSSYLSAPTPPHCPSHRLRHLLVRRIVNRHPHQGPHRHHPRSCLRIRIGNIIMRDVCHRWASSAYGWSSRNDLVISKARTWIHSQVRVDAAQVLLGWHISRERVVR
ncbi:hypothetical protein Tco_0087516 [Tanacetum coccineum]